MKYEPIPISVAKEIAEKFDKNQVIIVAWDKEHGKTHVTTFGVTQEKCEQAARCGNLIKRKVLGWPEEECNVEPKKKK